MFFLPQMGRWQTFNKTDHSFLSRFVFKLVQRFETHKVSMFQKKKQTAHRELKNVTRVYSDLFVGDYFCLIAKLLLHYTADLASIYVMQTCFFGS